MMSLHLPQNPIYNPTPILTNTLLLSNPSYQFNSNQFVIPTDTIQSLSPINYISNEGKLCYEIEFFESQVAEVGQDSGSDEGQDNYETLDLIASKKNLNVSAKPFNPNKKSSYPCSLPSISEDEESDCAESEPEPESESASDISYSINRSPTPIITPEAVMEYISFAETTQKDGLKFINTIPKPESFKIQKQKQFKKQKQKQFSAKFNNHAKGNFYISKEKISQLVGLCLENFDTNIANDEKLAFGYFKESVAMQINDGQIKTLQTNKGQCIIIINIDLHYKNGDNMYLIAMGNDGAFAEKVAWKITDFMTGNEIYNIYGITHKYLPKSSRNMPYFKRGLNKAPIDVDISVIYNTDFSSLPGKKSKRNEKQNNIYMSENDLKWYCEQSWYNNIIIPVVVIKGKRQWIEWKKFIAICDKNGNEQWIGISLRYYDSINQWKIECMDYDAGRIYYQYKLCGNVCNQKYIINYEELETYITTSLCLPKRQRKKGYNKRRY